MLWCHKGKNVKFSVPNSVHFVITDYSTSTFLFTTFESTKAVISLHNFGNTKSRKDVTARPVPERTSAICCRTSSYDK